jgi:hypothetical protein
VKLRERHASFSSAAVTGWGSSAGPTNVIRSQALAVLEVLTGDQEIVVNVTNVAISRSVAKT